MALSDSEIWRIRHELGYGVLTVNAEPYVGFISFFDQVVQPFLSSVAETTSSTAVTAASTATPATLTVVSAANIAAQDRVGIDVGERFESSIVQSVSGSDIVVALTGAHTGTYPVTVDSGLLIVREILREIRNVKGEMGSTFGAGALKKVDEIEFYNTSSSLFGAQGEQLRFWREELASALRITSGWSLMGQASQRIAVY